ncbi:AsmA family protein [Roseomonas hellenica]|nr:AsmA family protein [Plastoroseomonas hellenica]
MRLRRWMISLGVPVIAIAVIAYLFTWRWFIPILEQQASAALGRNVAIEDLDVRLGRTTEITFRGVRVDNPEGFQAERPFAQLGTLVALVDVMAYWNERAIVIPSITIDGADVQAIAASKESNNFTFALGGPSGEAAAADPSAGPRIGVLNIRNGRVHIAHAPLRADFNVELETRENPNAEPQLLGRANGTYADQPLSAELTGGAILSLRETERPWPIDLRLENGPTRARLTGTLRDPLAFAGADLRLELAGPSMGLLMPLTGIPIPQTPRYRVQGQLAYAEGRVRFTEMQGQVGNSDLAGSIAVDPKGERPDVTADLRSRRVDLADLTGFIGGTPGRDAPTRPDAGASGRILPDTPINLPKFEAANVHLRYRAGQIRGRSTPLDNLDVALELVDGVLTLRPLRFGVGRGEIAADITLTPREGDQAHAVADINFRRVDISRLMQAAGSQGGGSLSGRARIDGTGRSTAQLLARGNGALTLSTSGGNLSALLVDLSGLRLGSAILSALGMPDRAPIECFVADFALERGTLNTRALFLETDSALISGTGTIRLDQESIDYRIRSAAKRFTIAALPTGVLITGRFGNPSVTPEVLELGVRGGLAAALGLAAGPLAILPTIEFGIGDDPRCNAMLDRIRRPEQDRPRQR